MSKTSAQKSVKTGTFKAAMADIFMNLALVMVWLLFMSPSNPPVDAVPDQSLPPTDQKPGDRPAAGQKIAKIEVHTEGQVTVQTDGKTLSYQQYQALLQDDPAAFPNHFVFAFPDFKEVQRIGQAALQNDANVSIQLSR